MENLDLRVENSAATLDMGRTRRVIRDAFDVWSTSSKLTFQETSDPKSDIVIKFAAWVFSCKKIFEKS